MASALKIVPSLSGTDVFPGPRAFKVDETRLFFGREREASQLTDLVISYQDVLLYAQSGAGKSSLINARVVPKLGAENCFVGRVGGELPPGVQLESIPNIFVYNLIASTIKDATKASGITEATLEQYFHAPPDRDITFLIIDQSEELFTAYPERWTDRRPFFEQLRLLLKQNPSVHVLFAIREEYLASLEFYSDLLPNRLHIRYYLQSLRQAEAAQAIDGPLEESGLTIDEQVTRKLVDSLRTVPVQTSRGEANVLGEFVEPLHLQVVCQNLVTQLKSGETVVTEEQVSTFAGVDQALCVFYERALATAAAESKVPEAKIRRWFDTQLITPAGTRSIVFLGETETAGLPNLAVALLADQNVLRGERRGGALWYELTHDRFIVPIRKSNAHWREQRGDAYKNAQTLEEKAGDWDEAGRPVEGLLNETELQQAQALAVCPEAIEAGISHNLTALISASTEEQSRRRERQQLLELRARSARRLLYLSIASITICAFAIGLLVWGYGQQRKMKSVRLAMLSLSQLNVATDHSLLLAMHAVKSSPTPEAIRALRFSLHQLHLERTLVGHKGSASVVAFSPDGKFLASGDNEGTAKIWDTTSWVAKNLAVGAADVRSLGFTPDSKRLITASIDESDAKNSWLEIWDAATGKLLVKQSRPTWLLSAVNPKLPLIASAEGEKGTISLLAYNDSRVVELAHWDTGNQVNALAFSVGGEALATGGSDHLVKVWPVTTCFKNASCKPSLTLKGNRDKVMDVAFSPDDKYLASAGMDLTVHIWNKAGENLHTLANGHVNTVFRVAFDREDRLVSVGADARVKVWDPFSGRQLYNLAGHTGPVEGVAFSPDGKTLATASWDHTVNVWNITGHKGIVTEVAFSPDGKYLATSSHDTTVKLWDANTMQEKATLPALDDIVSMVTFNHDSTMIGASTSTGQSYILKLGSDKWWLHIPGSQIAFNPIAPEAATYTEDGQLLLYQLALGARPRVLGRTNWGFSSLAFSPDGKWVITGVGPQPAQVWEVAASSGQAHCSYPTNRDYTSAVAFSPDGTTVAVGSTSGALKLWNAIDCKPVATLAGHKNAIGDLNFSPDGKTLGSASWDKTARIWDVATGREKMSFTLDSSVNGLAFSPNGKQLALASENPMPWVYPLGESVKSEMEHGRQLMRKLGTTLQKDECKRYFDSDTCPAMP